MRLESLGADATVLGAFRPYELKGSTLARVATAQRDIYRLYTEDADLAAEPSGALRYRAGDDTALAVTGDWVAARVVDPALAIVEAVLPRRTCFARRAAGRREERQALAANIDVVFLVCGLDGDFNPRRLERYLTLAVESGAQPVVVLNKADVHPDVPGAMAAARETARGVPVVTCSARESSGLDALAPWLGHGRTVALLGSSGVGKSTIVNRLLGEERLATREVRESDSRGRHTTTRRELIPLALGGALIDTPGMRELQLWAGQESVETAFDEIARFAAECRYRDCSHSGEPGCAVAAAVEAGQVSPERWQSYGKLVAEARHHEAMTDRFAALEQKRKWKRIHKAVRNLDKRKG
jgi:ribosome biogenesis GTPase / thiamine phosphate phosphatase